MSTDQKDEPTPEQVEKMKKFLEERGDPKNWKRITSGSNYTPPKKKRKKKSHR